MNTITKREFYLSWFALTMTLSACGHNGGTTTVDETVVSDNQKPQAQVTGNKGLASSESLDLQVAQAISDLSSRTGIAKDAVSVSQGRTVNWGSSALGCPKNGMSYTQALVPGVLVILEADGVFYRYHGRLASDLFYCPENRAEEPAFGPGKEFM